MIKNIYSVYDSAAEVYGDTITELNHATAIRSFEQAVNREGSLWARHVGDFTLMHMGTFETKNGLITPNEGSVPQRVITAAEVLREGPKPEGAELPFSA